MNVHIADADVDDTHVISAFSDDTTVATVSVKDSALTIAGSEGGTTTVTVSATDDSGQDNAVAIPATFLVTVIEPINRGACMVGMTLQAGESCSYMGQGLSFLSVKMVLCVEKANCRSRA